MANETVPVRHIFICGAKSVGQYGGYETFVDKLTEYQQHNSRVKIHIMCKANGGGCMDESRLSGVTQINEQEFEYHHAHCVKLTVPEIGPAAAIWYDRAAVRYCIRYCRDHDIRNPVIYILTCRIGPFTGRLKRKIRAIDGELHVNPDGHEWMREKWPALVRKYWKLSESMMVRHADLLVCDSVNIEEYIRTEYRRVNPRTTYIAYGADLGLSTLQDDAPEFVNWLEKNGLEKGKYYLIVGRFVPENNYETMIREFMQSETAKDLAIITDANAGFQARLAERLCFQEDSRVKFVGTVYNSELLKKIRENAFAYIHGHEVGGTNPSLLEAMAATKVNLLLDVGFNREVGQDATLYWTKETGNLARLIAYVDQMDAGKRCQMGESAKGRIRDHYSWQTISDRYSEIWRTE